MDLVVGSYDEDSAVGSEGDFLALQSFSGDESTMRGDASTVQTFETKKTVKKRSKAAAADGEEFLTADDMEELAYYDNPVSACLGSFFGIAPENIVVKVAAVARPHLAKEKEGLCEPMPFAGMPKLVIVGQVMTKTPKHCPLRFKDRVLGFFEDERYYSETYTKLPFSRLIKVKKNLDPWQQVSIALSYLPALQILQSCPFTVDNNRILLNGGMGPINQALIRLCKLHGAKKIHVPVEAEYDSLVRELGAKPMGPLHSDWGPILIDTIDIVVDCIGENKFITSKAMLVETGHMIVTGCKDLDSRKGQMLNGLDKRFVDWRLNSSTRITVFDFMKAYVNDREVFEKDFKYLDKMVFDEQLPVLNTRIDMNQMNMANDGDRRETEALDGYQIMQIPNADGWKR